MKLHRKIDLYFNGDYLCSTNQSKTCREAIDRYLDTIDQRAHALGGIGLVDSRIKKNPALLKARKHDKA